MPEFHREKPDTNKMQNVATTAKGISLPALIQLHGLGLLWQLLNSRWCKSVSPLFFQFPVL